MINADTAEHQKIIYTTVLKDLLNKINFYYICISFERSGRCSKELEQHNNVLTLALIASTCQGIFFYTMAKKGELKQYCYKHNIERIIDGNRSKCKQCIKEKGANRFFRRNNFTSICMICKKIYGLDLKTQNRKTGINVNKFCSKDCKEQSLKDSVFADNKYSTLKNRCIKFNLKYEKISKIAVYEKFNYKCNLCGIKCQKPNKNNFNDLDCATIDHVIPKVKGGTHTYDNIQLLCRNCNNIKFIY